MKDPALLPVRPRSVLGRATRRIAAFALTVAGTAVATPAQIPAPTLTSIVTSPVALAGGDFEATATVPVNGYAYAPSWAPWSMTPFTVSPPATKAGSGIAHAGSSLFAQSAPPPSGSYVMFVEGVGTSRCNVALPPGLWRVRFQAAQRGQGTIADVQQLRVRLGGVTVFERELPSTAFVEYATLPIRLTTTATIPLAFSGLVGTGNNNIALVDSVRIEPVLDWSSATSWLDASGGSVSQPPGLNDNVRVAAGSAVALTGPSLAATVEVHGNLTAESVDCSLASEWLLVHTSGARLDIGSAEVPFAHEFVLTLRGQPGAPTIGGAGSKFLVAMDGGQIELHGLPKTSWSRLKSLSGNTVEVTDREGWAVGDQILLVATDPMSEQDGEKASQSEVCTIVGIAPTTGELTLSPAPLANHCAADPVSYSAPNGATWTVDERAEVGMLTHNVRVEGDASDSTSVLGFGAHVMMMGGASPGTGRFSHVQFRRMGQRKILGRYPLHWHMQLAAGAGQYARGCSVWESFNRALTIHGTDFVAAEDNVLFDHFGHGLFLEDGGEQHNTIAGNLVVLTRRPPAGQELLPHDNSLDELQNRSPAAFWISNREAKLTRETDDGATHEDQV
ncbi:MAG: G8 domain-containing protein [Planctomycetes bacterium]|nr:G8 domain-containing protein [Planctomycetota bacterium]